MGFEEEIRGRSLGGEWKREKEGEAKERISGGVTAIGDGRQQRKGEARERMEAR
ncbi:hypothetical protein TIFTF001_016688 [Ficus carica]|uniref:Uncharacterized protein n=1 Tax=Ficus carica TaxID=3494 RepID=A0AA88D8Z4_FICCA|nr:hypothetical protein TIFTF001_016688 [Ficus carica]